MNNLLMNKKKIILDKHSSVIQMSNKVTALQRKSFNVLILNAKTEIKQKLNYKFEIQINDIMRLIGLDKSKNYNEVKKLLKELEDIKVEYNILSKDKKHKWGTFRLLAGAEIENNKLYYSFPHQIIDMLLDPNIFAKINLVIIKGLKSKYSITLYELLEDYKNIKKLPKMSIKKFREIMGIEEKQYYKFSALKKYVIPKLNNERNYKYFLSYPYLIRVSIFFKP